MTFCSPSLLPHHGMDLATKLSRFPIKIDGLCIKDAPDVEFRQYFYATIEVDGKEQVRTSLADNEWHHIKRKKRIQLQACESSIFCLRLYLHRKFHGPLYVGLIEEPVHSLLSHSQAISREIPWPAHVPRAEGNTMKICFTVKHASATAAEQLINDILTLMSEPQADERSRGSETTNRLKMMTRGISDSYPCAKMALGILSTAYNIFPVEDDHRRYLRPLLDIVYETYTLASETSCLTPDLCTEPLSRLSRYAVECGYFIREFVGKRGILHSLVNQATSIDVDAELKGYIRKFDQLRSCFSTSGEVPRCQTDDEMQSCSSDDIHSESTCNMRRTKSTSTASTLDTVDDILTWANDRGQERICLLSGQHPAISDVTWHVTSLFDSPCSLYSFRHGRKLNDQPRLRHPRYFFGDIANDIAIKHPPFGHVLATSVTSDRDTVDTQFEQLILAPAKRMSDQGSVLVIIDALDECPRGGMRKSILTALAGKAAELLENFRILVTCRYEEDIFDALRDKMHVLERPFDMQC